MPRSDRRHGPLRLRPRGLIAALALGCAAPDAPVIALDPDPPTTADDLQVIVGGVELGDEVAFRWTQDGRERDDQFGATVSARLTVPGEVWAVEVWAVRGGRTSAVSAASVAVVPSVDAVWFEPAAPNARDEVSLVLDGGAGAEAWDVTWTLDGEVVGAEATLPAGVARRGQVLAAEVVPRLGELVGPAVHSEAVVVANAAPGMPAVTVDPATADPGAVDLRCAVTEEADDPDGDAVSYRVEWWVDGALWRGEPLDGALPGDTVPAASTADGAAWTCLIWPSDDLEEGAPGVGRALVGDPCEDDVDALTAPVHASFVLHAEEDDPYGKTSSNPSEPDYNGDQAVFEHYADAMWALAVGLSDAGATLSIQPEWTFIEGAAQWRPTLLRELRELPGVELAPHGHETIVLYDDLFDRLAAADADPQRYLGGMVFDEYRARQDWFERHPMFALWEAPTVSIDHVDDVLAPALAYRAPMPELVDVVEDVFFVDAASTVIVTPAVASVTPGPGSVDADLWVANKPAGRFLAPAYIRLSLRDLMATPEDTDVPEQWRTDDPYKQVDGVVADAVDTVARLQPYVDRGEIAWTPISAVVAAFTRYESCLPLADGDDLSDYIPNQ